MPTKSIAHLQVAMHRCLLTRFPCSGKRRCIVLSGKIHFHQGNLNPQRRDHWALGSSVFFIFLLRSFLLALFISILGTLCGLCILSLLDNQLKNIVFLRDQLIFT